MTTAAKEPVKSLFDETLRTLRSHSVYWSVDHPSENMLDRPAQNAQALISKAFKRRPAQEDLAGSIEALEGARRMLDAAVAKAHPMVIADLAQKIRPLFLNVDQHYCIEPALRTILKLDRRRAHSEVLHFEEYVNHARKRVAAEQKAEPDRRLPRESQDIADYDDAGLPSW